MSEETIQRVRGRNKEAENLRAIEAELRRIVGEMKVHPEDAWTIGDMGELISAIHSTIEESEKAG